MTRVPDRPECVDEVTYQRWWIDALKAEEPGARFCNDCTPEHKARMREVGLCSHPETVWVRIDGREMGIPETHAAMADVLTGALPIVAGPPLKDLVPLLRFRRTLGDAAHPQVVSMLKRIA